MVSVLEVGRVERCGRIVGQFGDPAPVDDAFGEERQVEAVAVAQDACRHREFHARIADRAAVGIAVARSEGDVLLFERQQVFRQGVIVFHRDVHRADAAADADVDVARRLPFQSRVADVHVVEGHEALAVIEPGPVCPHAVEVGVADVVGVERVGECVVELVSRRAAVSGRQHQPADQLRVFQQGFFQIVSRCQGVGARRAFVGCEHRGFVHAAREVDEKRSVQAPRHCTVAAQHALVGLGALGALRCVSLCEGDVVHVVARHAHAAECVVGHRRRVDLHAERGAQGVVPAFETVVGPHLFLIAFQPVAEDAVAAFLVDFVDAVILVDERLRGGEFRTLVVVVRKVELACHAEMFVDLPAQGEVVVHACDLVFGETVERGFVERRPLLAESPFAQYVVGYAALVGRCVVGIHPRPFVHRPVGRFRGVGHVHAQFVRDFQFARRIADEGRCAVHRALRTLHHTLHWVHVEHPAVTQAAVAAVNRDAVAVRERGPEGHLQPVGRTVGLYVRHALLIECVVAFVGAHAFFPVEFLFGIHQVECTHAGTLERAVEMIGQPQGVGLRDLRRDDDHSLPGPHAVQGRRRGVFEQRDAFDALDVEIFQPVERFAVAVNDDQRPGIGGTQSPGERFHALEAHCGGHRIGIGTVSFVGVGAADRRVDQLQGSHEVGGVESAQLFARIAGFGRGCGLCAAVVADKFFVSGGVALSKRRGWAHG